VLAENVYVSRIETEEAFLEDDKRIAEEALVVVEARKYQEDHKKYPRFILRIVKNEQYLYFNREYNTWTPDLIFATSFTDRKEIENESAIEMKLNPRIITV
jgi:hypothetical protein